MADATTLSGVRVLDLSRVLAGPFCTQTLADLGATVWKVEPPWGDETRRWGPPYHRGESAYYLSANRGKQSVAIDLKNPDGGRLAQDLAATADVIVENFKVGDATGYGLDYDTVSASNPGVVYASITGYGQSGPRANESGYDLALQGMTGLMGVTGEPGRPPVRVGVAVIDVMAGMMAAIGILSALVERDRSGHGQRLDISLFDVGVMAMCNVAQSHLLTGESSQRFGSGHPHIVPYQAFRTSDGWILLAVGTDPQFASLCDLIGAPELADDDRFASNPQRVANRDELVALLEDRLRQRDTNTWLELCCEAGIPAGPVQDVGEALADPQAAARKLVWNVDHPHLGSLEVVASALQHFSRTPARANGPPPLLGEHTRSVLAATLGLDAETLDSLESSGAINAARSSDAVDPVTADSG